MNTFFRRALLPIFALLSPLLALADPAPATPAAAPAAAKIPAVLNSECMDCHEAEFKPLKKGQPAE